MHDCPRCDRVCCCDNDDVWNDRASVHCAHMCEDDVALEDDDDGVDENCVADRDFIPPNPFD